MQMRRRDVAALDAKYTKELADAKADDARDDVAAGHHRFYQTICQCVKPPPPPAADNALSPTGEHR